jgi:cell wall-associated NlpC family hydrolase
MKRLSLYLITGFISILTLMTFCSYSNQKEARDFTKDVDSIIKKWVPDKREGIFDAKIIDRGGSLVLKGETSLPEAKVDLVSYLEKNKLKFLDSLLVLPDSSVIKLPWGLVNVSVCNMRSEPSHGAELLSQALLGTPVKILKRKGGWYMIQTPDSYLGWTDGDAVEPFSAADHEKWKRSSRVIFTDKFGDIFLESEGKTVVSDITAGCILKTDGEEKGYYKVEFPDGRKGFAEAKQCLTFDKWTENAHPEAATIIPYSKKFMGTPYLWGGTSAKGLDCSGFVKTVFYMNGLILARDVSLQIRHGLEITSYRNPDSLKAGDLLFFGSVRNGKIRATHVGIYIGNTEFIHESGMVRINSLDSTRANFSPYRKNSFLGARRVFGEFPAPGLQIVSKHPWYK